MTFETLPANFARACFYVCVIVSVAWLACPDSAFALVTPDCQTAVLDFVITGNEVTRKDYLITRSGLERGALVTPDDLDQARQRILDTQLFSAAEVSADAPCAERSRIRIEVEEKRFHLVYPRLSRNGNGDLSKGVKYQAENLFGAAHSFSLTLARKDYANGNTAEQFLTDYDMTLPDQTYHLRFDASSIDTLLEADSGQIREVDHRVALLAGRDWLSLNLPTPLTVLAKLNLHSKRTTQVGSDTELLHANYNTLGIQLEYNAVHYQRYRRSGYYLSAELDRGIYELNSDYDSAHLVLEGRFYLARANHDNFNSRVLIALASEDVFRSFNYTVGGADSLRGIETGTINGNALFQVNLEYIFAFQRWPSFRLAAFTDVGNVFDRYTDLNDHDWYTTYGAGLRWKLTSFVKTDLVIDMGYEPDTGYSKLYAGTSLPF